MWWLLAPWPRRVFCLGCTLCISLVEELNVQVCWSQISDPKVPSNVHEMASSLRQWRRCVSRAEELQVTLPDASILMLAMSKFADALGLSHCWCEAGAEGWLQAWALHHHKELAEHLQAEAEELSLATGSKPSTAGGGGPVVKAMNVGSGAGAQDGDRSATKPACKFWKSEDGCRKGQDCSYGHDTADMKGRCFGWGRTGGSDGLKPVSLSSVSPKHTTADLMEEATSLLKSLRTLKAVRFKQIMVTEEGDKNLFALLGATHCLRRARSDELGRLAPIQVSLRVEPPCCFATQTIRLCCRCGR